MVEDYILDKLEGKTEEIIGINDFSDTKILIEANDKLSDDITLKSAVILSTCIIKYVDKFNF